MIARFNVLKKVVVFVIVAAFGLFHPLVWSDPLLQIQQVDFPSRNGLGCAGLLPGLSPSPGNEFLELSELGTISTVSDIGEFGFVRSAERLLPGSPMATAMPKNRNDRLLLVSQFTNDSEASDSLLLLDLPEAETIARIQYPPGFSGQKGIRLLEYTNDSNFAYILFSTTSVYRFDGFDPNPVWLKSFSNVINDVSIIERSDKSLEIAIGQRSGDLIFLDPDTGLQTRSLAMGSVEKIDRARLRPGDGSQFLVIGTLSPSPAVLRLHAFDADNLSLLWTVPAIEAISFETADFTGDGIDEVLLSGTDPDAGLFSDNLFRLSSSGAMHFSTFFDGMVQSVEPFNFIEGGDDEIAVCFSSQSPMLVFDSQLRRLSDHPGLGHVSYRKFAIHETESGVPVAYTIGQDPNGAQSDVPLRSIELESGQPLFELQLPPINNFQFNPESIVSVRDPSIPGFGHRVLLLGDDFSVPKIVSFDPDTRAITEERTYTEFPNSRFSLSLPVVAEGASLVFAVVAPANSSVSFWQYVLIDPITLDAQFISNPIIGLGYPDAIVKPPSVNGTTSVLGLVRRGNQAALLDVSGQTIDILKNSQTTAMQFIDFFGREAIAIASEDLSTSPTRFKIDVLDRLTFDVMDQYEIPRKALSIAQQGPETILLANGNSADSFPSYVERFSLISGKVNQSSRLGTLDHWMGNFVEQSDFGAKTIYIGSRRGIFSIAPPPLEDIFQSSFD